MVLCLFLFALCGCRNEAGRKVRVSMVQSSQDGPRSIAIPQGYSLGTNSEYNDLLGGFQGMVLVASITPDYIILDVNKLQLFNSKDVQANIFNTSGDAVSVYEDYHNAFNMLHTRGLELNVPNNISNAWHHLVMSFTCWTGQATYTSPSGYNDYFTVNMVGIKLPPSVPEGVIQGMIISDRNREYLRSFIPDFDDYLWLSFSSLSPFNTSTPSAIVFSDTITSPQVYYRPGEGVSYYCIGNGNPKDSSNSTILELPMNTLDFRG
ncbi:MAG: hypothetical protein IJM73_03245, partial [Spirochaetales bacterium]|nr:hypothetical protein [Spirochaetales bacterium]